jgi:hypothetical protein
MTRIFNWILIVTLVGTGTAVFAQAPPFEHAVNAFGGLLTGTDHGNG